VVLYQKRKAPPELRRSLLEPELRQNRTLRIRSNQWIIRKTVILARIRNYRDIALPNGLLAEPAVFWIFFKSEAFFGFILFPILIDQSDHRDRYGANNKDRKDHIAKDLFGRSIEDIVFMQLPYPINIIGWTL
jgi:hypothetical protein